MLSRGQAEDSEPRNSLRGHETDETPFWGSFIWEFPKFRGTFSSGPFHKDPIIWGATSGGPRIFGSPLLTLEEGRLDFFQESFEGIA